MERTLSEIDRDIVRLFKERNEVLSKIDRQFPEVYTVFNNTTGSIDDNTFVLNPLKKRDYEYLKGYVEDMKDSSFKSSLLDWLKEYSSFRCITGRICEYSGSPVCCAHCLSLNDCFKGNPNLCSYVEMGDVTVVTDCEMEG